MARTKEDIQTDIDAVNAGLGELYSGQRLTEFRINGNGVQRFYRYQEVTINDLLTAKTLLEAELLSVTPSTGPTFRSFSSMPIVVDKGGIY